MGIDLATWRARIGLSYYHVCRPHQTRWRSNGGQLFQPGVPSWGVEEVMNDTPLVLKGCMTVVALSLILQYVVHSWSKLKVRGGGNKVCCHWQGATPGVRGKVAGEGTLLLRAIAVVIPLLLVIAGDVETNPGPGEPSLKVLLNELYPVCANWYNIGLELDIPYTELDCFRKMYTDHLDLMREVLIHWLKTSTDPPPTWEAVITALRSPLVNEKNVAAQLESKYCTPSQYMMGGVLTPESPTVNTTKCRSTTSPLPSEVSDKLPFGCGCGKCTFFSFIESGCPTPIPSASSFPYLDLSGLTQEQQQELRGRLWSESQMIMMQFQKLVAVTIKSFQERGVPLDELVSHVMALGAFDPVFKKPLVPAFRRCFKTLKAADTIPKVFLVLNDYFSFFNYHIIEHIIEELGTEEDKTELQRYKEHFNQYVKRRIFEGPPESTRPASDAHYIEMFVILDSQYENYTIEEMNRFGKKLSEFLHLPSQGILHLYPGGSIFHVPEGGNPTKKLQLDSGSAENQRQFNKAMQDGHVEAWLSKMLLYGAAGSGKTCTKDMIAGNPPPERRHSTPLAVRPATVYRVSVEGKEWTKLTTRQERKSFLARMLSTFVPDLDNRLHATQQESHETLSSSEFSVPSKEPNDSVPPENSQQQPSSDEAIERVAESKFEDEVHDSEVDERLESIKTDKELVEIMGQMSKTTDPLGVVRILHIIDSGGQPQFHEVLPIFLRQLSFYVFVFRLCDALDSRPVVELYVDGKQVGTLYKSAQTIEQLLQHCVRTMHSHGASSGCYPQIIVVGTHTDKMSKSDLHKMLKLANQKILKILLSSLLGEQIVYSNPALNEVVFPVNAADPGSWKEDTVKKIREIVQGNKSMIKSTKIPLKWFGLEVLLEEMAQTQGVLSKKECLAAAVDKLFFEEDSFNAAIEYLDKLSVLFHYPYILPDLVFADPQLLLNKLTELVVKAYEIENQPKALTAKWKYFREFACVDVEFLSQEEFSKHYIPNLFEPEHLVHLFKELFIFASISETELFVPCLLQSLNDDKVNEYRVRPYDSSPIPPLVIQFREGCPRKGVFCSLICFLTSQKNYPSPWSILREQGVSSPVCLYRNCIQFKVHACPGTVTLIDAYTHFEVHVKVKPTTSDKICQYMCQRIYNPILEGIDNASINLGYYKSIPPPAFLCPTLTLLCPCGVSNTHVAEVNREANIWVCSIDNENSEELTPQQERWINYRKEKCDKGDESVALPSKRRKHDTPDITAGTCTIETLLEELTDISGSEWFSLGIKLGVKDSTLRDIEGDHREDVQRRKTEMLRAWLQSGPTNPWMKLATALERMGNKVLAQKIREKYTTL